MHMCMPCHRQSHFQSCLIGGLCVLCPRPKEKQLYRGGSCVLKRLVPDERLDTCGVEMSSL